MSRIPEEIIYNEILLRLPVKPLLKFKCVCKKWYALISTSDFVKLHLHLTAHTKNKPILMLESSAYENRFYPISLDVLESSVSEIKPSAIEIDFPFNSYFHYVVRFVGSCYGLVCIWVMETFGEIHGVREFLCLWNAATREYKRLPPMIKIDGIEMSAIFAFGYDHKSDDYKLALGLTSPRSKDTVFQFYSVASNSWKPGPTMPYVFCDSVQRHGVLFNGYHHWLEKAQDKFFLLSLDICDESFKEMQLPKELLKKSREDDLIILGVLEGFLCILESSYVNGVKINVEVWEMLDYGVHESWARHYIIIHESIIMDCISDLVVLWSFEKGKILFMNLGGLVLYDLEHGSARKLSNGGSFSRNAGYYIESLVSLKSGTYVGGTEEIEELENPKEEE